MKVLLLQTSNKTPLNVTPKGLVWLEEQAYDSFRSNLRKLESKIREIGAVPIFGGVVHPFLHFLSTFTTFCSNR
jgi:hypothetical protein